MTSTVCPHNNYEDTGELRNVTTCKKRGAEPNWQPVFHCKDCGLYFAGVARHKVSPPPSFEDIKRAVAAGRLKAEDCKRYGYLTPEQQAELAETDTCEHEYMPVVVQYVCRHCGKRDMRLVEILKDGRTPDHID